jgi:ceramide glucosyltransferase
MAHSQFLFYVAWTLLGLAWIGSAYQILAAYAFTRLAKQSPTALSARPAVTLLKPLCGEEPQLYENLRSFCTLDYAALQIVFGVRESDDPAIGTVRRLKSEFPGVDIALVVDPRIYGTNYKVSNLINIMAAAKHDVIVLSDSDMHVEPDYLDAILGPLERPGVGLVTCLYVGLPTQGVYSALGAAGINFWFLPSAAVSKLLGGKRGCYGATIALTRATLEKVGGFAAVKDQLADDYELGAMVSESGGQVVVASHFPRTTVHEPNSESLLRHELRWARTIRNTAPIGFAATVITHPVPLAMLGLAIGLVAGLPWAVLLVTLALAALFRFALVAQVTRTIAAPSPTWWLMAARDALSLVLLVVAFCGRSVSWRDSAFRVDSAGALSTEIDGI